MDRFGNPNLSPVGSDSGQAVAQGTAGAQEAKSDADTTIIVNQSNMGGGSGGGATVPLPVTTKDNSSASQLAAVSN
jgi:ribulose 1,5-bisphosphate synthetase/thiazole synthase